MLNVCRHQPEHLISHRHLLHLSALLSLANFLKLAASSALLLRAQNLALKNHIFDLAKTDF